MTGGGANNHQVNLPIAFGRPNFSDEEIEAVTRVMRSGWIGMGQETLLFEQELATAVGVGNVVSVSSCTGALFLSLVSLGVGAGDEVICPSLTWCSTANVALYLGAVPVFCDVDEQTMLATPHSILAKVSDRTKAVIVVHYGGLALDVAALRRVLPAHIAIVEDAAHALGARYPDGTPVGASGNLTCFSFYANKNLSTGEGGGICCPSAQVAAHLASLRQHGLASDAWARYSQPRQPFALQGLSELGYKLNYTDLQAAIGRVQLRRQAEFAARRQAIADCYLDAIARDWPRLRPQAGVGDARHARHLFAVRLPLENMTCDRATLVSTLRAKGIGISIHYVPLHGMPLYQPQPALPVTDFLADRIMTLPISASMSLDEARYCWSELIACLATHGGHP